jgi:hypothetical protein
MAAARVSNFNVHTTHYNVYYTVCSTLVVFSSEVHTHGNLVCDVCCSIQYSVVIAF